MHSSTSWDQCWQCPKRALKSLKTYSVQNDVFWLPIELAVMLEMLHMYAVPFSCR